MSTPRQDLELEQHHPLLTEHKQEHKKEHESEHSGSETARSGESDLSNCAFISIPVCADDPYAAADHLQQQARNLGADATVTASLIPGTPDEYLFGVKLTFNQEAKKQGLCSWENVLKALFIPTAAMAFIFYKDYAHGCIENDGCRQYVSWVPGGDDIQWGVLFASGGSGFAFTNMFLAAKGASSLIDYVRSKGLLKAGLTIAGYTLLSVTTVTLAGLGAPGATLLSPSVVLPGLSMIPAAIYSAAAAQNSPATRYYLAELRQAFEAAREFILPPLGKYDALARKERAHYRTQFRYFQKSLEGRRQQFFASLSEEKGEKQSSPNDIFNNFETAVPKPVSQLDKAFSVFTNGVGVAATTAFTAAFIANSYHQTGKIGSWAEGAFQGLVAGILGPLSNFPNYELALPVFNAALNLFLLRTPDSVDLKLHPKKTVAITLGAFLSQVMSYSAVYGVFNNEYKGPDSLKEALLNLALAGIVVYHAAGGINVGLALMRSRISDPISKAAYRVSEVYDQLAWTPFDKFVTDITVMDQETREKIGVTLFDPDAVEEESVEPSNPALVQPESEPAQRSESFCSYVRSSVTGWCNWFKSGNQAQNSDVEVPMLDYASPKKQSK